MGLSGIWSECKSRRCYLCCWLTRLPPSLFHPSLSPTPLRPGPKPTPTEPISYARRHGQQPSGVTVNTLFSNSGPAKVKGPPLLSSPLLCTPLPSFPYLFHTSLLHPSLYSSLFLSSLFLFFFLSFKYQSNFFSLFKWLRFVLCW